jgi:hypothetical protein
MDKRVALITYVVSLALFAGLVAVPSLTEKRDIPAEVPSPPPLTATDLVIVRGGGRLCMTEAAISKETRLMRFKVGTYGKPGPALGVTLKAAGYSSSASVPAGFADNALLEVAVAAPPSGRLGTICIRNDGRRKIAFYAASDRARSRVKPFVDGKLQTATPTLIFAEAHKVSIAHRAGVIAGRIAVFRGVLDHAWIVWLLVVVMLAGVPALVAVALGAAEREPQLRSDSSAE